MLSRQDEVIRVGIRIVVVAAVVGMFVLLLNGTARSGELSQAERAAELLRPRTPNVERSVAEAESLLRRERERKEGAIRVSVIDTAWQLISRASPRRLVKSASGLAHHLYSWGSRSAAEDQALDLLEARVDAGSEDARLHELYGALRSREDQEKLTAWLDDAEHAIALGDLPLARRRLARARELEPDSPRVKWLSAELSDHEEALLATNTSGLTEPQAAEAWEAQLAAALLTGRYETAAEISAERADTDLAHAVALYLSGDREQAIEKLDRLIDVEGPTGELAEHWYMDPSLNPERSGQQVKRLLGVPTGEGWVRSDSDAAVGWRGLLSNVRPMELALSIPMWIAEPRKTGSRLSKTAYRQLNVAPQTTLKQEAAAWMGTEVRKSEGPEWRDGFLVLPPARTPYATLGARPLLVSPAALETALKEQYATLPEDLVQGPYIVFAPRVMREGETDSRALARPFELTGALADAAERGEVLSRVDETSDVLDTLRRIDSALRRGAVLTAESWSPERAELGDAFQRSLINGRETQLNALRVQRRNKSLRMRSTVIGDDEFCPASHLCLDRKRSMRAALYGRLDLSAELHVGASTSFHEATLAFEMSRSGPQASLTLPVARWLGLSSWLPLEAHIELGVDGISAGPRYAEPNAD